MSARSVRIEGSAGSAGSAGSVGSVGSAGNAGSVGSAGSAGSAGSEGSAKANSRHLKSCLVQVFNFKLGCFCSECNCVAFTSTPTSRVENSAQIPFF
jgi:hypothetical protein